MFSLITMILVKIQDQSRSNFFSHLGPYFVQHKGHRKTKNSDQKLKQKQERKQGKEKKKKEKEKEEKKNNLCWKIWF